MRRRYRKNPLPGGDTAILIGLGVLVVGGVGYALYKANQASSSASSGGSTTSPAQSYTLGPGGSGTPLPTTTNDFEAGAGANAPLVPTAGG